MSNRNYRLVLAGMVLATEVIRFATKIVALLGTVLNYRDELQVV